MTSTNPDVKFEYPSADGTAITAYRWDAIGSLRAIIQLSHGMGEHVLRYNEFARVLNSKGFVVYGQDHRGHGITVKSPSDRGHLGPGGWSMLVNDIHLLVKLARSEQPNIPLILLGHSMGSFAVQQYMLDHSADVDAVILSGTSLLDLLRSTSDLDKPTDLTSLNASFQPARTNFDWLTRDDSIVDAYVNDPMCGFGLDAESTKEMYMEGLRFANPEALRCIRGNLPVYICAGDLDPINGKMSLVEALVKLSLIHI